MQFENEYSENEMVLIRHSKMLDLYQKLTAFPLYRLMAYHAFIYNDQSPEADAIRRGCIAIDENKIYRLTPEFDEIIKVK